MYILALDEGYLQIEGDEYQGYRMIDYPGGIDYKIKANGEIKTVKIAPIGQIVIEIYNDWLQYDLSHGGTVEESLQHHVEMVKSQENRPLFYFPQNAKDKSPNYEIWENRSAENLSDSSVENAAIFNYLDFIPTAFMRFMGRIRQVFIVDDLLDLEEFDIRQLFEKNKTDSIRICVTCGKAFRGQKTAKYCPDCRSESYIKQIKENQKKNPAGSKLSSILDTAKHRLEIKRFSGKEENDYYNNYIGKLQKYIKRMKKELCPADLILFADQLKIIDQKFYKLFTDIEKSKNRDLSKNWRKERYDIWDQDDPEQWLRDWYKKADADW